MVLRCEKCDRLRTAAVDAAAAAYRAAAETAAATYVAYQEHLATHGGES